MSQPGKALAQAARELVGCRFRLHGRDPATGLDCVGLVAAALAATGARPAVPSGYGLRNIGIDQWLSMAQQSGLVPSGGPVRAGDVLLIALAHCQHHLVVALDEDTIIHAHAGLQRVALQPRDPAWQICAKWRCSPLLEG